MSSRSSAFCRSNLPYRRTLFQFRHRTTKHRCDDCLQPPVIHREIQQVAPSRTCWTLPLPEGDTGTHDEATEGAGGNGDLCRAGGLRREWTWCFVFGDPNHWDLRNGHTLPKVPSG